MILGYIAAFAAFIGWSVMLGMQCYKSGLREGKYREYPFAWRDGFDNALDFWKNAPVDEDCNCDYCQEHKEIRNL